VSDRNSYNQQVIAEFSTRRGIATSWSVRP